MRPALILFLSFLCAGLCQASDASAKAAIEKRTERIRVEDTLSRIDELRVGGETKTITVQPRGAYPSYQVQPASGERSWKILGF